MADEGLTVDLGGLHVFIGMPVNRDIAPQVNESIISTVGLLSEKGIMVTTNMQHNGAYIDVGRNALAHIFLYGPYDPMPNMFLMVDSDIAWKAEAALRIVALTKALGCVGATYVMRKDDVKFTLTGFDSSVRVKTNRFGCMSWPGMGIGLGFTCVTREIMQKLSDEAPLCLFGEGDIPVMREIFYTGGVITERAKAIGAEREWFGEDVNFFNDVEDNGFDVWLDPEIQLGHVGPKCFTASIKNYITKIEAKEAA